MEEDRFASLRRDMVDNQVAGRGVHAPLVLEAMRCVPREAFVSEDLHEFIYEDTAIARADGSTVAQPSVVAMMLEALGLAGGEKVLEIGTGSGYATALLARIAAQVFSVEPDAALAAKAVATLGRLGRRNVHLLHGDIDAGWPAHAPFGAILVNAGGTHIPDALKQQLRVGGCLVMPMGADPEVRELVRVTRVSADAYRSQDIADLRLPVSLASDGRALSAGDLTRVEARAARTTTDAALAEAIAASCERFATPQGAALEGLLRRVGDARVVLLGEATHGSSEFYSMRERITRELIVRKGFSFVAIEGDWPDAARIDHYVRQARVAPTEWTAFARFPVWMWRNREMRSFVDWLRQHNAGASGARKVAFHGLDLYSLYHSIRSVLRYLDDVDPKTAAVARHRYACLTPWQPDPATYGRAALTSAYHSCEREVVSTLGDLLKKHAEYADQDGERFLDAVQNARLVANAERYYRIMYYGSRAAWNLRDSHMFETLKNLLAFHGPQSKAVVWAHNSHVGDSAATDMSLRGEFNIGHLCRKEFGHAAFLLGFGTHQGTVAAASDWDAPMQVMPVRPSMPGSYERLFHDTEIARFLLPLRDAANDLVDALSQPRLERAIGVIYRPQTEYQSHYFNAVLARQFDEYIWFDETRAVTPLKTEEVEGVPETYPFGV